MHDHGAAVVADRAKLRRRVVLIVLNCRYAAAARPDTADGIGRRSSKNAVRHGQSGAGRVRDDRRAGGDGAAKQAVLHNRIGAARREDQDRPAMQRKVDGVDSRPGDTGKLHIGRANGDSGS